MKYLPVRGSGNRNYLPDEVHIEYPWDKPNIDSYGITTRVHTAEEKYSRILELLKDKSRFLKRVL